MATKKTLLSVKGISEAKVDKIKEAIGKLMGDSMFRTAAEVKEDRKMAFKISTGASTLDAILGGGIESQCLTEVFGEYRCGKTQLSHTLCVSCQIPDGTYSGGRALFMDTEATFRPARLEQIAARFGLDSEAVLDNVVVVRVYNSDQQIEVLESVAAVIYEGIEQGNPFKLIVVDSVMALFRVDYHGRGELSERQQKLAQFLSRLQKISEEFNVAVFMTNQMCADPGAQSFAPTMKPIGGHILAHASTWRLHLTKCAKNDRKAKIFDSPDMPEAEAKFSIGEGGIGEPNEKE